MSEIKLKNLPSHCFLPVDVEQSALLWQWRNSPRVRANMHSDQAISWQDHQSWFEDMLVDNTRRYWMLYQNKRPVGVLNFSDLDTSSPQWGCYLGETDVWPGSGIIFELAALDYCAASADFEYIVAQVLSFNHAALKLHKLFEYEHLATASGGERNELSYQVLHYRYELNHWRENRLRILKKLPKQMRLVADNIQFLEQEPT